MPRPNFQGPAQVRRGQRVILQASVYVSRYTTAGTEATVMNPTFEGSRYFRVRTGSGVELPEVRFDEMTPSVCDGVLRARAERNTL